MAAVFRLVTVSAWNVYDGGLNDVEMPQVFQGCAQCRTQRAFRYGTVLPAAGCLV